MATQNYSAEFKLKAVKDYLSTGDTHRKLKKTAAKYGISIATLCSWNKEFQTTGAIREPKKRKGKNWVPVTAYVEQELYDYIQALADSKNCNKTDVVRAMIIRFYQYHKAKRQKESEK